MSNSLPSIVVIAIVGLVVGAVLLLQKLGRRLRTHTPASAPTAMVAEPVPVAANTQEAFSVAVARIGKALAPLGEDASHPNQLAETAEFREAVATFSRPDASTAAVRDYALGDNWPLACAAYTALATRPDRQSLVDAVLRRLPGGGIYVLTFALRFIASLERRPPAGAPLVGVPAWWTNHLIVAGAYEEFFTACAAKGDKPEFGDSLDRPRELDTAPMVGLLHKIQHPFAAELQAALRAWMDTRIDRELLSTVGTLWEASSGDPLLARPEQWRGALATAEAAIRQAKPRSIVVCGEPRVGKTTFVKLLARRFQDEGWIVFAASGNELMAGQKYIGELEGRMRELAAAVQARRKILWYVPDLAQFAIGGRHRHQPHSMLDQLLPDIAAGTIVLIGETSQRAAAALLQSRPSLRALMEVVALPALDEPATASLMGEVGRQLTAQLGLAVPDGTVAATMNLAQQYLGTGHLPGTALELLKRAADRAITNGDTTLSADGVIATLSQISGLPPIILDTTQRVVLSEVQAFFTRRVMGQDEAVKAMVDRIAMLKAGLTDPGRPIGVFLFAGPTGTGKTELAKTLAEYLFGSPDRLVRLDMSEFQRVESTVKILGEAGGEGDSLIDRIRKQPFSVVLLDEFEKAHPNCWDLFLQVFDDGRLSDANGNEADFRHCIVILTSNLGATSHRGSGLGFRTEADTFAADQVLRAVGQTFRPEFVNRLDKIIVFRPLTRELMRGILHKELARVVERRGLRDRSWAVEWEASAIEFLLDRGFSPEMGARPLKRAIDQLLLAPLAATLVEHRFPEGDQFLFVRANGREIEVEFVDPDVEPGAAPTPEEPANDVSLPAIVLSPTGSPAERAALAACWRQIADELAGEPWRSRADGLRLELADPAIWSRADRQRVFTGLELADRVAEAARTAERLVQRYTAARDRNRSSRELAGRLALQLLNVRAGMSDFLGDAPIDVLLAVEPALDMGASNAEAWCRRLTDMYRGWSARRHMQLRELAGDRSVILAVTGFGAFRTLAGESGLHLLENESPHETARVVARVTAVAGASLDLSAPGAFALAAELLAESPPPSAIVRRYREQPAPLVRDIAAGWRSGRLDAVLAGDFDLIGATRARQAAA
jgi:ATP-dependent Clp protease ATP-binding subunit ClpC